MSFRQAWVFDDFLFVHLRLLSSIMSPPWNHGKYDIDDDDVSGKHWEI